MCKKRNIDYSYLMIKEEAEAASKEAFYRADEAEINYVSSLRTN